jgi:putative tryptophan/tyrosine transport system substrate-binding protein
VGQQHSAGYGGLTLNRRGLIALFSSTAISWPLAARAQQKTMPVVGWLASISSSSLAYQTAAFLQGLNEIGYVERKNVAIEYRWAEYHYDRLPALAADLVRNKVDVIVTNSGDAALAAKSATSTIPIVSFFGGDPVAQGLVAGLARPGGNLTGVSILFTELTPKLLDLLVELAPQARVIDLLVNPNYAGTEAIIREAQEAARAKGVQLHTLRASTASEIDAAFASVQLDAGALLVGTDPFFLSRREQLVGLASRESVPAIYNVREFAAAGGLISYGPNISATWHLLGIYAGKILNGAKPADMPVQRSTTLELVVNLKTAKALGLTVPQSILVRADEVIE